MKKITIGLTGGFATGKSTVLSIFKKLGAGTVDSDLIVHDILKNNTAAQKKIIAAFGAVADKKNGINRKKLGKIVFADKNERLKLEHIIHPLVKKRIARSIRKIKKNIIVVDVPLLFEARMKHYFDYTLTVYCGKKTQVSRAMERGRLTRAEAVKRISIQLPLDFKIKHSDFVISTDKLKQDIKRQSEILLKNIKG